MWQTGLSSAASKANGPEERGSFDVEMTAENMVRHAMEMFNPASRNGMNTDSGAGTHRLEADLNPQSPVTDNGRVSVGLSRIVDLPRLPVRRTPATTFHALQEWEGHVVEIGDEEFTARLTDVTAKASYEREEAVIPLAEISDEDAAKMREGSIFRWVIGYERSSAGTKKRVSQIVFRDLPAVTKADLSDGEAWARAVARSLDP